MSQRLDGYTRDYYCGREPDEYWFQRQGLLRCDQLAALSYALGRTFWGPGPAAVRRDPGVIVSVGCGEGYLEAALENLGCTVIGIDPSPVVASLYRGKTFLGVSAGHFDYANMRTVIFCESLEHIPIDEIRVCWPRFQPGTRVIVVNWPDVWPIDGDPNGTDHITRLDDAFYDTLSAGHTVVLRRGSHLVLDF